MLVPLLAAGSLLLGAALPGGAPSPAPVRYAGLTSCPGANGKRHICGPWRLWLRGGGTVQLKDAQIRSLDARGREEVQRAPVAVDPYGRHVAYFAASDRRLVVRNVGSGGLTRVPGTAGRLPSGLRMSDVELRVGPEGRYLVLDPTRSSTRGVLVIEVATGKAWTLPAYASVQGFSPEGRLLRVVLDQEESAVYRPGGAVPSAGVTVVGWGALTSDGATVAGAAREGSRVLVRFYATSNAMESRAPVRVKVPPAEEPRMLRWDSGSRMTLLTFDEPRRFVARSVEVRGGGARMVDSFTVGRHTWDVHLAGD
ncbi:hypothetical protein [Nonomuraea dietziae]|uniref:hypothetical protein n=1 Tax=Nonomuraea dietziae TaxID=65515 RepID=UPI00341F14CC